MNSWRPKDWDDKTKWYDNSDGQYDAFEAGADTMLEAIKRNGYISGQSLLNTGAVGWQNLGSNSKWYCIPEVNNE